MAEVIIAEVNGEASIVRGDTGEQVTATVGMTVYEGDVLDVSPDGFVTVSVDGELRTLPAGQSVTFPLQLDFTENNSDDEFAVFDESVDEFAALLDGVDGAESIEGENQAGDADFLDALAGDGDILESLEATAAGLDGGAGTGGGSNFVRVDRINEDVDPAGFQFDQNANDNDDVAPVEFSETGEQAQDISLTLDAIGLTSDTTPTLSGITSAIPGSTVTLTVTDSAGNIQTVTAIVQGDGTFNVDVPNALADGEFTVDATVLEPTGNTADSSTTGEIDATAPTITINAPGSDNDTTPTLSGTTDAAPGSTVTLTITDSAGNTQTVTAIVQADGTYSADVPAELAEGEFTVNASVSDEAGNTATADTTGEIDTTAPSITIDAIATDNDTTPTLSGTTDAAPGSTVTLTITDSAGNTQTVTAIVQADGTYSADVPAELAEGEFTVNASVSDEAGNTATADTTGEIDTTAPSITIDAIATDNDTTPTLSGTTDAAPGSTVTLTITDSAGNTQTVTAIVQADGTYSADVPAELAEGEFTVNASVTDEAGNTASADTTGVIDTTAPSITIDTIATGNDTTPTLSGTTDAAPGSTVTLTITDSAGNTQTVTAIVQADGTYSADVPAELAEGEFTVNASVTDEAGNTATTDTTGEIDTTAPSITIDTIATDNDTTPTLSGTTDAAPGSTVTLTITDSAGNTQTVTAIVQADGTYSADVPAELAEGEFTINASVTDEAGNTATTDTTGEIDTTAPSITIDAIATGNDTTPTLSGTTDAAPGSTVTLTITDSAGNTQTVTAIVEADGTYSADVPAELAEGEFTVNASVTDEAGNTATADTTGEIDTTSPSITIDAIATGNDTTPTLSGTTDAAPGSTVTLTITDSAGNTQTVTAIVQADGTYSADVPAELAEGEFTVNASVTDGAGNTANADAQGAIDVTAPTIALNDPGINGDATPTLSGLTDAVPGSTITLTVTDSAGVTQTFTTTVLADGTFTVEVPNAVAEGTYNVTAEVTDGAGNTTQATASGDYDSTSPSTTVNQPAPTNDTTPNVSGETDAPPGSEVVIVVTDSEGNEQTIVTTVGGDGTFNEDVPAELSEGEYTVDVTVTTPAGNSSTTTVTGEIDTTAPIINLDPIGSTNDDTPVINGDTDAEPGAVVTLDIVHTDGTTQTITATVQEDGSFSAEVPQALANGDFTVTATVSDVAGNTASTSIDAVINTQGPNVVIETGSPTNGSEGIGGSSDAPNSEVVVVITDSDGNSQTITGTTDENGNFNVSFPPGSEEGEYDIEVTVTDENGNSSTATATTVLDTTPPVVNIDPQTDTNDTTPTISGNTDLPAGSEVDITVTDSQGNTQTVTALVDENGNFSADVGEALAQGSYEVSVEATDAAGNTTTAVDNSGNIDITAPTLSLDPQTDGSDTTPTISGSTDLPPGSTVTIAVTDSAGNTQTIDAIVDENGDFSVDAQTPLTEGEYTVEASATDDAGNTTTVTENGGNIDTQAPTISLEPLGTGNDTTPSISGSTNLEAGSTVTLTVTDSAGNSQTFTATVDANGEFSADVPAELADGDYTVEATATDAAGNSASTSQTGTVDSNAPSLTLDPLGDDNDTTPTISGTTDLPAGSTVTLSVTDALGNTQTFTATVNGSGNFSVDVPNPLAEGEYSVTATATDANGNTATATETGGNIDITSPLVNLDAQGSTNDTTPTISGNTDQAPGSSVAITVTDSAGNTQTFDALVQNDGTFSVDVPAELADGDFTVTATVTDDAGNQDSASTQGNIDTAAPTLSLDPQDIGNDTTPLISGTTDLPQGSTVTLVVTDSLGNQQTIEAVVGENGNFSAEVPSALAEGNYSVTATAVDENGNSASVTENGGSIDTTAPSLSLDAAGSGNDTTPTLSGSTDLPEGSVVSLTVVDSAGNTQTINTLVDANGNFSVDVPQELADGNFTATATAEDAAGNEATDSTTGNINTNAPTLVLDGQNETNDNTPTISGSTSLPQGSEVTLTVTDSAGNTQTITATVGADGSFTTDVASPLPDGPYTVTANATDGDGNTTTVTDNGGTIDTTAPSLTLENPGSTGDTTPTLSGTTDLPEGSTVTLVVTDSAGNTQTINALVDVNGSFSVDVPNALVDGDFTVTATATDSAGNTANANTTGNVDSEAPLLTLDTQGATSDVTPTITGTSDVAPGTLVTITVVDANGNSQSFQAAVQADGTFSADVPNAMAEGDFTVTATVSDAQGNTATANEANGSIDTQAPIVTVNPLDSGNDTTPVISGNTDLPEGAVVAITVTDSNGDTQTINALVDADGNFATEVLSPLPEGDYSVEVTATDDAGNSTTATEDGGNIDTTAPVLTLNPQGTGNDETPNISGSTDLAPGSTVTLTVTDSAGNTQTFDATVNANGDFSADVPNAIPDGSYTVTASASDDAGNTTTTSDTGTLDTSAPALTLDAQVTVSDTTPNISGTTDLPAGSTVTLFVTDSAGNTQTFTALVDASGNFSADVPAPLAEGDYSVTATATDSNGNSASVTDNNGIVDTVAPVISLDALGSNNDTTPTMSGTTDLAAGESVTLSITDNAGNNQTVTATVDANGNFTVDVPAALAEGDYTVTATATDDAGNSASANATGTIDTTAPTLTLEPQGLGNDTTPTISGSTDLAEGSVVSLVITDSAGNIQTVTAAVDAAGNFTVDVLAALAEGSYSVEATATDEAGNSTSVLDNSGVIDITPPELNLEELAPENNLTPTISGTTNLPAGAIVTLTVVDSAGNTQTFAATVQTDGSFAANVPSPLAEGDYTVTATAQDAAGNQGSDSETGGSVDTTAPVITLDPFGTGNDNTPTISGSTDLDAGSTVTITVTDSAGTEQTFTATVDTNGDFSADVPNPMADGNFDVTATATDAAGNTATDTVSGDINSAAPTLSLDPLGSGNDTTPTISGDTDLAPGSTVTLTVTDSAGNTQTFSAIVQGDGSFTADVPVSLPEGDYSVTATATDGAGNSASVTENGGNIDTIAPSITIDTQELGNDATPSISGTTDLNAGDTVSISVTDNAGNTQTFTAIVQNDGTYSADVPADLAEGSFSVTVTATDEAGNSATAIDNNGIIDTAAPTVTLDAQSLTNDATPTISGTTDLAAGNTVSISVTDSQGNTQTFTATVQANGSFSADVPFDLAEGDYTVEVTATDDAGNQNTAVDNNGTVDTTPPVINLDPVASGNDATPVLSGTTDLPEGATITLVVTDAGGNVQNLTATVNADGTFSVEVPSTLVDGDYDVTASASDAAGNSTTVSDSGNINTSAPDITLDALGQTNDTTPLISGTTNAPVGATVTLTVTDSAGAVQTFTTTVQGDGTFSASVPSNLAEGSYTVVAEVTDGAGNSGSDSETGGVVDTTSPAIDVAEPGVGNDATPTISGTTDQPAGSTVSITVTDNAGNIQNLSATVQNDGSFSVEIPATLAEGNYTVEATVVDEAGNTASDAESGVIDTISPVITLDDPGTISDSTPTISGTVDLPQGSTVQITVVDSAGNTQVFSALVAAGGVFSADVPAAMAEGSFTVSATATDTAGNSTTDNEAGVVDTLVPTLTIDVADTTNDATPLITGTTDEPAGSVVTILVTDSAGATQTLSAVVQGDGTFSISPGTDLAEGDFTISANISDEAGNTATAGDTGNVDTTAPSLTLTPLEEGNDTTPTLSGGTNLEQGSEVTLVVTDSAGNVQTITATVDVNGNFTVDVPAPLAEGVYSVEATASDEAGNSTTVVDNTGVIDTTAPTLSLDTLAPDSDTTPTISGNTDLPAGATVTITVTDNAGVSQTFDATVQGDGSFSADVPNPMAEGGYTVTAVAQDPAGNETTATETNGSVDTTAPTINLDAQGTGNDTTPTITGSTDLSPGSSVTITVTDSAGAEQTFTAIVDSNGDFSADVPNAMADGNFDVTATATDAAGNSASDTTSGNINTAVPTLTLDSLGTGNDTTPTISGTTDIAPGSIVSISVTDNAGVTQTFDAIVQANGTFSVDVPAALSEGNYSVTATATDASGNTATANENGGVIDTTAPAAPTVDAGNGTEITGTAEAGAVVNVDVDGDGTPDFTVTADGDGNWTVTPDTPLADGVVVTATATDEAGNTSSPASDTVDAVAPIVDFNDLTTNDTTPALTGSVDDPTAIVVVTINGTDYTATNNGDGSWTLADDIVAALAEGSYTATVTATDADGNTGTNSGTVVIDITAPAAPTVDAGNGSEITGTAEAGATVNVDVDGDGTPDFTVIADGDGNWSVTPTTPLADGVVVTATAVDEAGNVSAPASDTVDAVAPVVTINDLTTNDATPELTGTVDDSNAIVVVTIDGVDYTATNNGDGSWTLADDAVASLADGSYAATVTATDADGNVGSNSGTVVIDTTPPAIPTVDAGNGTEITGTAEAGATVNVDVDGDGTPDFTVIADGDGNWSITPDTPLADGVIVTVTATDAAGNISNPASDTVDAAAPIVDFNDLTTNDTTPELSGSIDDPTATVVVTINGADYTATNNGDGTWTLADDAVAALAEGSYTATVTATDPEGNVGTNTGTVVIDTTAPAAPTVEAGNGTEITGTAEAGATVNVDVNGDGTPDFTVIADGDGNWSVTPDTPLADGVVVTATATDEAGNTSGPASDTVDAVAPIVTINDVTTNDTTPALTGTVDDPTATVVVTIDGVDYTATNNGDGTWTLADDVVATLAEGSYPTSVTATDDAGNTDTDTGTVVIDTTAPTVAINDLTTNDTTPELTGTVNDTNAVVVVTIDGSDYTATNNGDGTWTLTDDVVATLAEGSYPTSVTATDAAGNTVTNTGTVVIDTTAPTVAINDLTTNDSTPELNGAVNDPNAVVVVTIDGNDYTATNNGDGTWTLADNVVATLAEGSYPTSVSATDAAGNTVTNTGTVIIDTTAPTVAINDLTTNDTTPELTGTVNDPNAVVVVTIDGNDYTATNNGDGTWTLADNVVATLAEGSYPTSVSATDAAGNTVTNTGTVTIDVTAPTVAINDLTTNDTTPELTGAVNDPNAVVVVTIDGNDYTATNNGNGTWTLADDVVATLAEGSYPTSVTATDAAGNTVTNTGTVVIDTTAPTVAINDLTTNDTTPELTGTVNDPNAVVVVTIDGVDYTATNNGDGTWTLADNIVALLAEGNYTAVVTATDAVGNVATDTSAVVIDTTIDGNNNGQTVTFDSISNDSGVAGDFITSDSTLIFNGTVDLGDNTTLTVTVDGTSYTFGTDPELTIDGSGNWSLDLTGTTLPAGTYAVVATVTDEAGNSASTASQNVVVQALDAINDGNTVDMGEPVVTVNPPETTSNVDVIGLTEATGGVDASASFTVSPNHVGEVLVEVDQIALVAVADAYIVEVYDQSGQLVYKGVSANSQLADVGGLDIFDVTGDETISFTLAGLDAGNYSVVVRNDENLLEDLLDNDNSNDVNLQELGSAGVVLGPDNQAVVLDTIETTLNTGVLGIPIGTVGTQVRGVLEVLLDTTTVIGAGQLVNLLTAPLDAIGLTGFLDDILSVIADALLSNTLTLLQDTDITTTLTEYTYTGDLVAQGNLIDGDIIGVGADTILNGAQVTLVTNASGDSVAVPATGTVTIQGNYGVLEIAADGTYTYTADGDRSAIGQDEVFNYTLSDGETSDIAALTINISGSDFPPVVAQTDNNDMELGAQTAIVNAPVSDSDFQVLGLTEGSPAAGSPEASTTLTVDAGFFGEVVVEVSQTALVAVADAYRVDIIDADGNVVASAMTPDNPLIGDVAGVNLIGVTGDDTLVAKFSGLPAGDYTVVVRNDESALETLFDQNSDGSITLTELGDGGVVLGEENQEVVLTAVEAALNGTNASVFNGLGLGTVVRNFILEPALGTADSIGAGDLVSTITNGLNALGLGLLADSVLDAVAAALLSNTLTLLQSTDITSTLTEYQFEGSTTTSGNVIDAANTGDVADSIAEGGVVTQVTHTNGESVTVLGTGLSGITIEGDYGDLTIFEDGSYTYVANGVRDGLGSTDSFSYTISDGTNTSTANLNFNLSGQGVSADSARAELIYDFATAAGVSEPDALTYEWTLGVDLLGLTIVIPSNVDTVSNSIIVAENTIQDITLTVDGGDLLSLGSGLDLFIERNNNGTWEVVETFSSDQLIGLLGLDGNGVFTSYGLSEGEYRVTMDVDTGAVSALGGVSVDLSSTVHFLDQFVVEEIQTATGNLFENDVLFGPTYDVTVSTDGTNFQDATGGITLVGDYGTLQIDETGAYTYTPDNTQAVFGGTLTDTFTYRIEYPDGTVEQAEFNVFVTASGEGVPEVVTTTSSESVSASDSSGTVVTDEPTAPDVIDLTGQTLQTVDLNAETRLVTPENEATAPLLSTEPVESIAPVESTPEIITLPEEEVSTLGTNVGEGFGGGDTIDLSGTKLDTVDIGGPIPTAPDEGTSPLSPEASTPESTAPEPITSGTLPEDTITLPEEGDIVTAGPVTEVTVDVVDIDLPPEDLILPSTEPTSTDSGSENTLSDTGSDLVGDTSKEGSADVTTASPTESEVLKTAIDKLPPTDI
ncbi:beta strand repeat-containing protein [Alteromonas sp. PRIM-21]|uniref:beta strand repeat-containing protein n=1 Tax=Alteromonas sp. PRIM-21 TaxID=1454978 RepID=UPI0022B9D413|nr:BapA/Bap/LapF family large adhesin [Alteromonas sp. PRIM-21]